MFVAIDVDYQDDGASGALAACVLFRDWADEHPVAESVLAIDNVAPYQPGQFYRRELPAIERILQTVAVGYHTVVVDGYVWLDARQTRAGLGAHLYAALGQEVGVVGVAKNEFAGAGASEVLRGASRRPLYVTSVGTDHGQAVAGVQSMHGAYRMPTLLGRVDALARGRVSPA